MADGDIKKEANGYNAVDVKPDVGADTNNVKSETKGSEDRPNLQSLEGKIVRQVEHYFGDYNLPRDKFLKDALQHDEGWVSMETMLKFQRLAGLSLDPKVIMTALKTSGSGLMEVDEEGQKIRRCPSIPLPEWNDERKEQLTASTVYVKGFEKTKTTLDDLLEFFNKFPNVLNVSKRLYEDRKDPERKKHFKGSVFVVFTDRESAEKFMKIDSLKSDDNGEELIRKWQKDYLDEKDKEFEEKKKQRRDEKQSQRNAKEFAKGPEVKTEGNTKEEVEDLPLGAVLHLEGFDENGETKREDIKEKLEEDFGMEANSIAFVYYNKGEASAKLRFQKENAAQEMANKIKETLGDSKLSIKDTEITFKVLEGEEEKMFLEQCKKDILDRKFNKKSHKRRGGFGGRGGGRGGKRQRTN